MRFKNGSNKVVIEVSGVQFWSEIILVIFEITRMTSDLIIYMQKIHHNITPL